MTMEAGYAFALTTGVIGGFGHCIGMCGPLIASYALGARPQGRVLQGGTLLPHLLYNTGRIITYTGLGAMMGLAGSFVNLAGRIAGIQNAIAILSGVFMIFMGANIAGIFGSSAWIERHNTPVLKAVRDILTLPSWSRFLLLGLVLGFLPCGLSYTIFIAAAGTGSPLQGMTMAALFGLGTVPALVLFGTIVSSLSARLRGGLYRAGGVLVIVMGMYFLVRGIRLYADL
jgi:sulfite exporter TauE/SafE